jgi:hypothetical protein
MPSSKRRLTAEPALPSRDARSAVLVIGLAACGGPSEPTDREHYRRSIGTEDPSTCVPIIDASARGECEAFVAHDLARGGRLDEAREVCRRMATGMWRDECLFLVVDASGVVGEQARELCAEAGTLRGRCLGHALNRAATRVFIDHGRGEELEALAALEDLLREWPSSHESGWTARSRLVGELADRETAAPFSTAGCGTAPADICRDAFVERVRRQSSATGNRALERFCAGSRSAGSAERAGLPPWDPDAEATAVQGWNLLCRSPPGGRSHRQ